MENEGHEVEEPYATQRLPTVTWNEDDLDKIFKYPCYAFQRGNIIFTTTPPPRDEKSIYKRGRSSSISTSTCNSNSLHVDRYHRSSETDFCEVCCGIRSPSFARRAQTYTTHFCTRVPAKKQLVDSSTSSISDHRSKSTGSANSSLSSLPARDITIKNQGHISRLSTFLRLKCAEEKFFSESDSSSVFTESRSDVSQSSRKEGVSGECEKCGGCSEVAAARVGNVTASILSKNAASTNSSANYSFCSSSYPSSTASSYFPLFLDDRSDVSTCCDCSSASCLASSFEHMVVSLDGDTAASSSSNSNNCCNVHKTIFQQMNGTRNVTRLRNIFSSSNDDSSSDSDADGTTSCSSEMGWSFSNFYEIDERRAAADKKVAILSKNKSLDTVTPFVANASRKMDVLEKFGNVVNSLRKPGHHIGPSKNTDCLCYNCKTYFSNK